MSIGRYLLAVVASGIAVSFVDWFFFGILFHDKYFAYPEVWRIKRGESDAKPIILSTLLGFVTCAAFICGCTWLGLSSYVAISKFALFVWVIAALPLVLTNGIWVKIHSLVLVAHSAGWLARLLVAGVAAGWALRA